MKHIFLLFSLFFLTQSAFAADYFLAQPVASEVELSLDHRATNATQIIGIDDFYGKNMIPFSGFFLAKKLCLAPTKNGEILSKNALFQSPFSVLKSDENGFIIKDLKNILRLSYDTALLDNRSVSLKFLWIFAANRSAGKCFLDENIFGKDPELNGFDAFLDAMQNGDTLTYRLQYPVGTTFVMSGIFPETFQIVSNFASIKNLKTLAIKPQMICHQNNSCSISRAEITLLDGTKQDITAAVQSIKNTEKYFFMDPNPLLVPANTAFLTLTFAK